jgi:predicted small integral membrane protein
MGGACSSDGEGRGVYRVLVRTFEGKRQLGRSRLRWEDNIKMDLQEGGYVSMDWIELVQDRDWWWALVNAVMNLRIP